MSDQTPDVTATDAQTTAAGRPERAIEFAKDDGLGRGAFVRRLADALIDGQTRKSRGIAIGITGPWGSGKSSILNLLQERIKELYHDALVVRFDPWLVSGRNDLVSEFIGELIRTIKADARASVQLKKIAGTVAKYGEYLAPATAVWSPILGPAVAKTGAAIIKAAVKSDESLSGLKARLMRELAQLKAPVVVLIDEVDRVEDDEIRTVAQLVRSVADFPGISYVLAYDAKRVIQALGSSAPENREERGRAYLEKIVQLQIPLPVIFGEELARMLASELDQLKSELRLPTNFPTIERYKRLVGILSTDMISTPRDIARLVGTFHAICGMVRDEVDWIDVLGFCGLLVKAPQTVELIKSHPDEFTDEILSEAAVLRQAGKERTPPQERLSGILPPSENNDSVRRMIAFLFPQFSSTPSRRDEERQDGIYRRRPLLTTLRLGLLPGGYSRAGILDLIKQSRGEIAAALKKAYDNGVFAELSDRLEEVYDTVPDINHVQFWLGIGDFLKKPDCQWLKSYSPMHEVAQTMADMLERCAIRNPSFGPTATAIFSNLRSQDEDELTAHWIRRQIFLHGLFGRERNSKNALILNEEQTKVLAMEMSHKWRPQHLMGNLISCHWDLMPVYTMIDTGVWDELCRKTLDDQLNTDEGLDGFTLLLFGGHFSTGKETVTKICSYENYVGRAHQRLSAPDLDDTVREALSKVGAGW